MEPIHRFFCVPPWVTEQTGSYEGHLGLDNIMMEIMYQKMWGKVGGMTMGYWNEVVDRLDLYAEGAWLIYISGALLLFLSLVFKKHITSREWYLTFGVVGFLAWMGNIVFFFQLDLLDSGDPSIGGLADTIMFSIAPSCVAILYLNFYKPHRKWTMSILFTVGSLMFEYLLVQVGFLTQKGWRVWYSTPFYWLMYFVFLPWHLHIMRGLKQIPSEIYFKSTFTRKEKVK